MDQKKLEQKLTEIFECGYVFVSDVGQGMEKIIPTDPDKAKQRYVHIEKLSPNINLGLRVIKIRSDQQLHSCDWCGQITNPIRLHKKVFITENNKGRYQWQHQCRTCMKIWDPKTNKLRPLVGRGLNYPKKIS